MDKHKTKSVILYITYTVILVALLIKLDQVLSLFTQLFLLFVPLFLGGAIAFILKKPYDCIYYFLSDRLKINKKWLLQLASAVLVYLFLFGIIAVIVSFIVPQLSESWKMLKSSLTTVIPTLYQKFELLQQVLPIDQISNLGQSLTLSRISDIIAKFLIGAMPQLFLVTNSIVKVAANIVMGLVFSVYFITGRDAMVRQSKRLIKAFLSEKWYLRITRLAEVSNDIFTRFVGGQLTEAFILGGLCFVGMVLLRLEYALLISVLIGLTSLIPIVGAFIGAVPSAFILLMIDPQKALIFVVFLIALQQFEGNIIYPKVVGGSIGLPPVWILLAITVGGGMFGVLGMMLAVPTTSVIYKLVCEEIDFKLKNNDIP